MEQKEVVEHWYEVEFLFNGKHSRNRFSCFNEAMSYAIAWHTHNPQVYLYERCGGKLVCNSLCWTIDKPSIRDCASGRAKYGNVWVKYLYIEPTPLEQEAEK